MGIGVTVGRSTLSEVRTPSEKAAKIEEGHLDVTVETDRTDELGDLYRGFANMRDSVRESLQEKIDEAEQARTEAERAREDAERFSEHLERTATEYEQVIQACADGDFTRRLDPDDESEAMAGDVDPNRPVAVAGVMPARSDGRHE